MGGKRPGRGAPAKRSVPAGLAAEGAGVAPRRHPAEFGVRPLVVVQGDEITPTRSRNSRFFIGGIRGSGMLFMSMR